MSTGLTIEHRQRADDETPGRGPSTLHEGIWAISRLGLLLDKDTTLLLATSCLYARCSGSVKQFGVVRWSERSHPGTPEPGC